MTSEPIQKKHLVQFQDLAMSLSPENLNCDGEITSAEAHRKYVKLTKEWKRLEKKIGRAVGEDEVFELLYSKYFNMELPELLASQLMRGD